MSFLKKTKGTMINFSSLIRNHPEVYGFLEPPSYRAVPLPNTAALLDGADKKTIMMLVDVAKDNLLKNGSAGIERQFPGLTKLRIALLESMRTNRKGLTEKFDQAMSFPLTAGWMIGEMENASGIAKPKWSEGHYWNAMVVLGTTEGQDSEFLGEFGFGIWASYYVARMGESEINVVIAASKSP